MPQPDHMPAAADAANHAPNCEQLPGSPPLAQMQPARTRPAQAQAAQAQAAYAQPARATDSKLYRYVKIYRTASLVLGILALTATLCLLVAFALYQPTLNAVDPRYQSEAGWYNAFTSLASGLGEFFFLYLGLLAIFGGAGAALYAFIGFCISRALQRQLEGDGKHMKALGYVLSAYTLLAGVAALCFVIYWLDIHFAKTVLVAGISFILAGIAFFNATRKL